jgi:hypothetical protein
VHGRAGQVLGCLDRGEKVGFGGGVRGDERQNVSGQAAEGIAPVPRASSVHELVRQCTVGVLAGGVSPALHSLLHQLRLEWVQDGRYDVVVQVLHHHKG